MTDYNYRAFGLNIRSDWPLPSLASGTFADADLHIRHEAIEPHLGQEWHANKKVFKNWEAAPARFLMKINGVANYLAKDGNSIFIERTHKDVDDDAVTAYMMGSIMAAILQQRKVTLLHGSSVQMNGRAAIFAGSSGIGKSTLAAKLMTRGHALIADDVAAITKDDNYGLSITPAFPTSRLWHDAVAKVSLEANVKQRVRPELDKYLVSTDNYCDKLQPISAIYILRQVNEPDIRIVRIEKRKSHHLLNLQGFRNGFLKGHVSYDHHFQMIIDLASSVPVFEVHRPITGFELNALADAVIEHNHMLAQG
jgi:hypothetical protein